MNLFDIVMRLNGPVRATGSHERDQINLRNLGTLTELTRLLLLEIHRASDDACRQEASMRAIGKKAKEFLDETRELLGG